MTTEMGHDDIVKSLDIGEFDMIKNEFTDVIIIQDLLKNSKYNYNQLQLKLYPNCKHFISIQGGSSIFASYFGGINIIFARKGFEIMNNTYNNWYHKFGNSQIKVVQTYEDLILETNKL